MRIFSPIETNQAGEGGGRGKINIKNFFKQFETRKYKIYFKRGAFCKKKERHFLKKSVAKHKKDLKQFETKNQKDILTEVHFTTKQKNLYGDP